MTSSRPLPARLSPRPVRTLGRRLARSEAAAHLRVNAGLLLGCSLILVLALAVGILTDGVHLTWNGWEELPTGTDAGLLPSDAGR